MSESIDFTRLKLERVINESTLTKSITFQGTYNDQMAVIRLDKTPFETESTRATINHKDLGTELNLANDIYWRFRLNPSNTPAGNQVNDLKAIVVWPANDTVLAKYAHSETVFFEETEDCFSRIVSPFIESLLTQDADYNKWIYNILEGKSESQNVIMNDQDERDGFILLPSLKSSGDDKELHVLAICHRRDIRSLRDLNDSHLPLLRNISTNAVRAIKHKYSNLKGQLRAYIHYQPTFYHFHVHFELVDPSEYKASDRDNLLTTVINNITLKSDYYARATLTYPLNKTSALYRELESKKYI